MTSLNDSAYSYGKLCVCQPACLTVILRYRDHIGWNSSKVFPWLVSLRCQSLQTQHDMPIPKGTPQNFDAKWPPPCWFERCWYSMATKWLEVAQWSQWRAYRKPQPLFRMVLSMTPYDLPFPQYGEHITPFQSWCIFFLRHSVVM